MFKNTTVIFLFFLLVGNTCFSQSNPNTSDAAELSPNSAGAARISSTNVNYFTGIPSIGVPLYTYSGQGFNFNISADYFAGGSRDGEGSTAIGQGWFLNSGGAITRTTRGAPDDAASIGFMYSGAIPVDFRSQGDDYYYDSLDTQQDVFNFNFNGRSGKFVIGKNHQIIVIPQSKLKVEYTTDPTSHLIISFKITTEDGEKYYFNDAEKTVISQPEGVELYGSSNYGFSYNSSWYLSKIISSFNTDTINLSYSIDTSYYDFNFPQTAFFNTTPDLAEVSRLNLIGENFSVVKKITEVDFPNKIKVNFIYNANLKYDKFSHPIYKITISDSIVRKGFLLNYQTSYSGPETFINQSGNSTTVDTTYKTNLLLSSIIPYTALGSTKGYTFVYNQPFPSFYDGLPPSSIDSLLKAFDYWGFFNAQRNNASDPIPAVSGRRNGGARRQPNLHAIDNTLAYVYSPEGGVTHYEYEMNMVASSSVDPHSINISNSTASSQTNISLSQLISPVHKLSFTVTSPFDRSGSAPLTGTCNLICSIKSTDGLTTYLKDTISLYDMYYQGIKTWTFPLANGTYRLETALGSGTTSGFTFSIAWNNKISNSTPDTAGGIRIYQITNQASITDNANKLVQQFKYVKSDGTSSGFLGDIPKYDYPYTKVTLIPAATINLTAITSDPVGALNYAQGSAVGYSRVEVISGTATHNLGKTVYSYSDLSDVNANYFYATFPYTPQDICDWGLGTLKKMELYDSSGNLVEKKTNQLSFNKSSLNTPDFKSIKLGCTAIKSSKGLPNDLNPIHTYIGEEYYPSTGWVSLTNQTDTIYYDDGSIQTSNADYIYDSYYNISKITSDYDRNRGLKLETRIYHPYDYTLSSGAIKTLKDSNIISQVISTEKWIVGDANPRMIDADITNFYQLTQKYIVPQHIYKFQSNAPVNQSIIGTFNPTTLIRNTTFLVEQTSFPIYYGNGIPAQQTNIISGENSAVILDYNFYYPIAKISNAAFSDVAYTSFESDGSGRWSISSGIRDKSAAMTGKQSYNLSNGPVTSPALNSSSYYILTGWVKSGAIVNINGSNLASITSPISTHNNWNLYSYSFSTLSTLTLTGSGLIDELRLYPVNANMVTSTYEPTIGITSTCDANNTIIYTEYDNLNRVKLIRDVDRNIVKRYDYSDSDFSINAFAPNWVATKRICTPGGSGTYDSVYVDNNPYSSTYNTTMNVTKGTDMCACSTDPLYRVINGLCEKGQLFVVSCVQVFVKPPGHPEQNHWEWQCTYHYKWSDGYETNNQTTQSIDGSPCIVNEQ